MSRASRAAAVVSILGHPFLLIPVTIALLVRQTWLGAIVALAAVGAMLGVIAWRVARGRWSDYDVSDARQRHDIYPIAALILIVSTAVGWWLGMAPSVVRGFLVGLGLLAAGAALTRVTKVSLHMMFGAFCAGIALDADPPIGVALAAIVGATAWSRVALRRHTPAQVTLGVVVGAVGALMLVWLNRARR